VKERIESKRLTASSRVIAIAGRVRLYGALQSLFKMHPLFDRAIAKILLADPFAVVLLSRTTRQRVWENAFRVRLTQALLDAASKNETKDNFKSASLLRRVIYVNQMQHSQYQQLLCSVDVALDTFPFGGGVTLSDAIGGYCRPVVPFVTAGPLQSVHQIGAGIAAKVNELRYTTDLSHGKTKTTASTSSIVAQSVTRISHLHANCSNCENISSVFKKLALDDIMNKQQQQHLVYIKQFAAAAITVATSAGCDWKANVQNENSTMQDVHKKCDSDHGKLQIVEAQTHHINRVLFSDDNAAAREWNNFLRNIFMSTNFDSKV
jgi:hypothetical protein